jgi:hypothetical protein
VAIVVSSQARVERAALHQVAEHRLAFAGAQGAPASSHQARRAFDREKR